MRNLYQKHHLEVPLEVVSLDTTNFSVFSGIQFHHCLVQEPLIPASKLAKNF